MVRFMTNVMYTQAFGCLFCLHVGSVAFFFGRRNGDCLWRLELCTPLHWFRWRSLRGYEQCKAARAKEMGWE